MDWKKIAIGGVIAVLAILLILTYASKVASDDKLRGELATAKDANDANKVAIDKLTKSVVDLNKKITDLETENAELKEELNTEEQEPTETEEPEVYEADELVIGEDVSPITLSDKKLSGLLDSKVEFNGDEYDFEELAIFSGLTVANDDEDYAGEAYLTVEEGSVVYKVVFDNQLDLSEIGVDEEYLVISFLGRELEILEWDGNEITVREGTEYNLKEGEQAPIDGKYLVVDFISDNNKVSLSYNGESKTVSEGSSKIIGGLDVYVDTVLYNARNGFVVLFVGNDVRETYTDGDEFDEDSIFNWYVDGASRTLGVVLDQGFEGNDPEEDYNALAYHEAINLPYNYLTMTFEGLTSEDMIDFKMDLGTKDSIEYVRITGKFEYGTESYSKLYVDKVTDDIYVLDDNNDLVLLGSNVIDIENSDFVLVATDDSIKIEADGSTDALLEFYKDFAEAYQDEELLTGDSDFVNSVGMRTKNVEDSAEDEEFAFSVPEEAITATISFTMG